MGKDIFRSEGVGLVIDCLLQKKNPRVSDVSRLCGFTLSKTRSILYGLRDVGLVTKREASRGHAARYAIRSDARIITFDMRFPKPRLFLYSVKPGDYTEVAVSAVGKRRKEYGRDEILEMMKTFLDKKLPQINAVCAAVIGDEKNEVSFLPESLHTLRTTERELICALIASTAELESFAAVFDDGEGGRIIYSEGGRAVCSLDASLFKEGRSDTVDYLASAAVAAAKMFHVNTVFVSSVETDGEDAEIIRKKCLDALGREVCVITNECGGYDVIFAAVRKSLGLI